MATVVAKIKVQVKTEVQQVCYVLHSKFEHELHCSVFRSVATPRALVPSRDASCWDKDMTEGNRKWIVMEKS